MGYPRMAKNIISYHGRSGKPVIHKTKGGRLYIMVRATGGGTKRLYDGSKYTDDGKTKVLRLS